MRRAAHFLLAGALLVAAPAAAREKAVDLVDPFVGTLGDHGQLSPAAVAPYGMVQLGPDTEPKNHAGYDYAARALRGFSHTRAVGVGCGGGGGRVRRPLSLPRPEIDPGQVRQEQARCLLAIAFAHPWLLPEVEEAFAALDLPEGLAQRLQHILLSWPHQHGLGEEGRVEAAALLDHLQKVEPEGHAWLRQSPRLLPAAAGPEALPKLVAEQWWYFFGCLRGEAALRAELAEAERDLATSGSPAAQTRMIRLKELLAAQLRGEVEEEGGGF